LQYLLDSDVPLDHRLLFVSDPELLEALFDDACVVRLQT
jgi:hypothetical protein